MVFAIAVWGVIIGCGLATLHYLFMSDAGPVSKIVLAVLYVVSWLIDPIWDLTVPWDFYIQLAMCFYYAFWHKMQSLPL